MNKLAMLVFGGALVLGAANQKQTFTGVVTDAMCGADHSMMGVKPDANCVRECVKRGSKYALLSNGKVYELSNQQMPDKYAAQKVKVTGSLNGDVINVDKIEPAK